MKRAARIATAILILLLGFWLWSVFFPSPEKAIRRHLEQTAQAASFDANEGAMDRLSNLGKFGNCFSPDVEVQFEAPGGRRQSVSGRQEIMQAAGMARTQATALKVEFLDAVISLAPDGENATVELVVRATVPGDRDFFVQEMKLFLRKFGRSWLIIRAETIRTLS